MYIDYGADAYALVCCKFWSYFGPANCRSRRAADLAFDRDVWALLDRLMLGFNGRSRNLGCTTQLVRTIIM